MGIEIIQVFGPQFKDMGFVPTSNFDMGRRPGGGEGENKTVLVSYEIAIRQNGKNVFTAFLGWQIKDSEGNKITDDVIVKVLHRLILQLAPITEVELKEKYGVLVAVEIPSIEYLSEQVSLLRHGDN